jgi:hypothetical protein
MSIRVKKLFIKHFHKTFFFTIDFKIGKVNNFFSDSGNVNSGNSGFNMGESQATSEDLEFQAQKLISKLKRTQNLKQDKKWKVNKFFSSFFLMWNIYFFIKI